MAKSAKEARPLPDIASIESPQSSTYGRKHAHKPVYFPPAYCLIVTTTKGVYSWDRDGVTELFRSGSEGIVAARKLPGTGEMLAVADSQVVVLHDIKKGMQKSYRLKGSEGQVRFLKYAGNSSQNLFFTTSLRNSVQCFSLKYSKILDPSDNHPSPPSVFALSCTAHLLLSASATPSTIFLRKLGENRSPTLVRPQCSSSTVVAASFHPESENIFLLAFADGSAAVYDASLLLPKNGLEERIRLQDSSGAGGEIGFIQRLHANGSRVKKRTIEDADWIDDSNGNIITAEATGITAVALVPGHKAMAVTVGADGKCCVIDFTKPTRKRAILIKSWHLRRPATSLSVVYFKDTYQLPQLDGVAEHDVPANKDYCIAVGRQDGKVLLFDLGGKPLGKQILDPKGARVVDVEWAKKEIDAAFAERERVVPDLVKTVAKKRSLGTEVIRKQNEADSPTNGSVFMDQSKDPLFDEVQALHLPMKLMKAIEQSEPNSVEGQHAHGLSVQTRAKSSQAPDPHDFQVTPRTSTSGTSKVAELSNSPPPIPPRPMPKPGGKLSMRRAETAREIGTSPVDFEPRTRSIQRRNTDEGVSPSKLPLPKTPPTKMTLFGPRPPQHTTVGSWKPQPKAQNHDLPSASLETAQISNSSVSEHREPSSLKPAAVAKDDKTATPIKLLRTTLTSLPKRLEGKTSTASLRSYTTASSRMDLSENSADTVVDWSASSSSRRLDPSIREPSPAPLSNQRSFFRERPPIDATMTEERPKEKKEHESINQSPKTTPPSPSSGTCESGVSDTVVHWPSLRKSPFIADLGIAVESATASVLDLGIYTDDPTSPPKTQQGDQTPTPQNIPNPYAPHSNSNNKNNRFIPPRLPLKVSPPATQSPCEPLMHTCQCEPHLEAIILSSVEKLRAQMEQGFKAQRLWLEDLIRGREHGRKKLEEENQVLREELRRAMERGKGGSG